MSAFNDIDITCAKCGEEFVGTIWTAIHTTETPELRELLLGGELNMVSCTGCGDIAYHDHFLLYQDPKEELVAYVYKESDRGREETLRPLTLQGYHEAQETLDPKDRKTYEPILLFGLEALVELLENEEFLHEEWDVAKEVCLENEIPVFTLRPAQARAQKLPRILPVIPFSKSPTREHVLKGISRLLELDPALSTYATLRKKIAANPGWSLAG